MKLIIRFFCCCMYFGAFSQPIVKNAAIPKINTPAKEPKKAIKGTLGFIFGLDTKNPDTVAAKLLYVFAGSPAADAGLFPGTLICAVNNHLLVNESIADIAQLLAGDAGTEVTLKVKRGIFGNISDIKLTRKPMPEYAAVSNYNKATDAYRQNDYAAAVQLYKKAGDYPDARLMLALIYAGMSNLPDSKSPDYNKNRTLLASFENVDSAKAYINPLLIEGYPYASFAMYWNCLIMSGSAFYKNYSSYYTYNHTGLSNYWLYESAGNDQLTAQEELIDKITSNKNDEGFSHDKNEALYWYTRAITAGTKKGTQLLASINNMPAKDYHFIHFEDVQAMTKIAHLYKEDKYNYKGISDVCPFGIRGCRSGYYSNYGFDNALKMDWYTYYIADHNDAVQIFDAAAKDMKSYFSGVSYSGADWYTINEYMDSKPEKSLLVKFTATETDGKTYNMQLGMVLQKNSLGYYIVFIYEDAS